MVCIERYWSSVCCCQVCGTDVVHAASRCGASGPPWPPSSTRPASAPSQSSSASTRSARAAGSAPSPTRSAALRL
eukprot:3817078-Rhodomonas_salina.1